MFKKIFLGFTLFLILIVAGLVAAPFLFKDKIIALVKKEINQNIRAHADFGSVGLSIIKSFPDMTVSLNDFSLVGVENFNGDTLAAIREFSLTLDIMSLIKGNDPEIKGLFLVEPYIHARVDKSGAANWDIMKSTEEQAKDDSAADAGEFKLSLQKYAITKGRIYYDDKPGNISLRLDNFNHSGKGDFTQDLVALQTNTFIGAITAIADGITYLKKAELDFKADLDANLAQNIYTFKENALRLNALLLKFDGSVGLEGEDVRLNLALSTPQTEFKHLLSLLPNVYTKDFENVKTSGSLGFNANVNGVYSDKSLPAFDVKLKVENASFQYPGLPGEVKNIQVVADIQNKDGKPDNTIVDVPRFHLEMGANPFDARFLVKTPVSDPDFAFTVVGKVDLNEIPKYYPLEGVKTLKGLLDANLEMKGRYSFIEKEQYEKVDAKGNLLLTNLEYAADDLPDKLEISRLAMRFNPKNVTLEELKGKTGRTAFEVAGTIDNLIGYALADEMLKGSFTFNSPQINLNDWMTDEEATAAGSGEETALSAPVVPTNLDLVLSASVGKLLYDKVELRNMAGNLIIRDGSVMINNLRALVFGGSVTINGSYSTKADPLNPEVKLDYDVKNIRIEDLYPNLELSQKLIPITKHLKGRVSSDMKFELPLNQAMEVDYTRLLADGTFRIPSASVASFPVLEKIADEFKISWLKQLDIKDAWTVFKIQKGRFYVDPFEIKQRGLTMNIAGSNGLDQSLDYVVKMAIPSKELGAAGAVLNDLISKHNIPGLNTKAALPEVLNFDVLVGGLMDNPTLKVRMSDGKSIKESVVDQAKELVDEKLKEAEEKARQEAERLKKEAEDKVRQEADKAKQAADKAKKEAEEKARQEAEKAKKEAEEKAKQQAKDALKNIRRP